MRAFLLVLLTATVAAAQSNDESLDVYTEHPRLFLSAQRLKRKVGSTLTVLIDEAGDNKAVGRSSADAPEIDGTVRIRGAKKVAVGEWAQVRITKAGAYDLEAQLLP